MPKFWLRKMMYLCRRPVECRRETSGNAHAGEEALAWPCAAVAQRADDHKPRQLSTRMRNSAKTCMAVS